MENINEALSLLAVGMIMVFLILFLVIVIGNVVVLFTNRFVQETQEPVRGGVAVRTTNSKKLAAITAVVDMITQGEGRVSSVQKNK